MRVKQGADLELIQMIIDRMMDIYESYDWNSIIPFDAEEWGVKINE